MGNDRDDKFEGQEESEYHFSDEEVSYEVENEAEKPASPKTTDQQKENIFARLSRSKRMLISLGVFLVLVFVVYKMVSPSTSTPPIDIATAPTAPQNAVLANNQTGAGAVNVVQNQANTMPAATPSSPSVAPPVPGSMPVQQAATTASTVAPPPTASAIPPAQTMASAQGVGATSSAGLAPTVPPSGAALMSPAQQAMGGQQSITQQPTVTQPTVAQPTTTQPSTTAVQPATVSLAPGVAQPTVAQPTATQATMTQPAVTQSIATPQQIVQPVVPILPQQQVVTNLPAVIPVQPPPYNMNQPPTVQGNIVQQTTALAANRERLMTELEGTYTQKLNEYSNQNKALQEQVQTLNSKVANIESQLNQLVQLLTRQQGLLHSSAVTQAPPPPLPAPQVVVLPKVAYNVQAIIPGRAWLKSDSGETLTVAEGDVIKEVGRVTKIDPYDGLVEINTGTKVISLSYGNGG